MSDDLDRAIDARMDAYRPETLPPFSVIESRKRRRDRNRVAAAAALGVVAVATAAIAVPGPGGQGPEQLAPVAAPTQDIHRAGPAWDGRSGPLAENGAAASCIETYSPTTIANRSFAFDGTVTAIGPSISDRADKGHLDLAGVTFTVNEWFRGGDEGSVIVDLAPTGTDPSYAVGSRLLVSGEPRWGGEPLDQPIAWGMCGGFTRYYDPETARVWQDAFAALEGRDNLRLTTDGVRGATLCLADAGGEYPDSDCRLIGKAAADRLTRALDGAQPQGRQPLCTATGPTYRLMFDVPSAKVMPIVIPTACGPITVGPGEYRINDRIVRAVGTEYGREAKHAEFIERCVGATENAAPAPEYIGLTEDEAMRTKQPESADTVNSVRVVGRDGICIGGRRDLRNDRVNLIVMDGEVVWAGRF